MDVEDDVSDPSIYHNNYLLLFSTGLLPVSNVMTLVHFRTLKISCMNVILLIKSHCLVKPCPILFTFIKSR